MVEPGVSEGEETFAVVVKLEQRDKGDVEEHGTDGTGQNATPQATNCVQ